MNQTTNLVILNGTIGAKPVERTMPSGTLVLSWDVSTEHDASRQSAPVVWESPTETLRYLNEGDPVIVIGYIRRRYFRAGGHTMSRTEIVGRKYATPDTSTTELLETLLQGDNQ